MFIVRGDDINSIIKKYENNNVKLIIYNTDISYQEVVGKINSFNNYLIVGIGNIVGWGEKFIREISKYKQ